MAFPQIVLPTFSGSKGENYEGYFADMADLKYVFKWSQDHYTRLVRVGLKGKAAAWLQTVHDRDKDTVGKIKMIVKEVFGDKRSGWLQCRDLNKLKQLEAETVWDFALRIREYDSELIPEQIKLSAFINGLLPPINDDVMKAQLNTLNEAVRFASRLELVEKDRNFHQPQWLVRQRVLQQDEGKDMHSYIEKPSRSVIKAGRQVDGSYLNRQKGQRETGRELAMVELPHIVGNSTSVTEQPSGGYCKIHKSETHDTQKCVILLQFKKLKERDPAKALRRLEKQCERLGWDGQKATLLEIFEVQ